MYVNIKFNKTSDSYDSSKIAFFFHSLSVFDKPTALIQLGFATLRPKWHTFLPSFARKRQKINCKTFHRKTLLN